MRFPIIQGVAPRYSQARLTATATAVALAAMISACGGGGGSPTEPSSAVPKLTASGEVAKGRVRNARVAAHAVNADGSVAAAELATATTDGDGRYALPAFDITPGAVYVIAMTAQAGTEHLDEVTGSWQAVPASFTMRAALTAGSDAAQLRTVTLTPFSEMAVAAGARAAGGLTSANVAQANATIQQIIGLDATAAAIKSVADTTATADERKLAGLLTAVSQLAATKALGCSSDDAGERTGCVVTTLASAASTTTLKLAAGPQDVSAALSAAIASTATVDTRALLAPVQAALACVDAGCNVAAAGATPTGPTAEATAIAEAKALFAQVKADLMGLVSRGGAVADASGAANQEAWKFRQVMDQTRWPVDTLRYAAEAINLGDQLWHDYMAGRTTVNWKSIATPLVKTGSWLLPMTNSLRCTVFADDATLVPATSPAEARVIACSMPYVMEGSVTGDGQQRIVNWRHTFLLTATGDGSYTYRSRVRRTESTYNPTTRVTTPGANLNVLSPDGGDRTLDGTVTIARAADGSVAAAHIAGRLPPPFVGTRGTTTGTALAGDHMAVDQSVTLETAADGRETLTLSAGRIETFSDATTRSVGLTIRKGYATRAAGQNPDAADLDLTLSTTGANGLVSEFDGRVKADQAVWDRSRTLLTPTRIDVAGVLRNVSGGVATEFITGALTATSTGYEAYDASLPGSVSNTYTATGTLNVKVTAPGRPDVTASISVTKPAHGDATSLAASLRSSRDGVVRSVVHVTSARNAGSGDWDLSFNEAASGLSMAWPDGSTSAQLLKAGAVVGRIDSKTKLLTFVDGSFMSLDLGL